MLSPLLAPSLVRGANILWDELRAGAASGLSFAQELLQGAAQEAAANPAAAEVARAGASSVPLAAQIDAVVQRIAERVRRQAQTLGLPAAGEIALGSNGLGQLELNGGAARTPLEDLLNTDDALLADVEALQQLLAQRDAAEHPAERTQATPFARDFELRIGPQAARLIA